MMTSMATTSKTPATPKRQTLAEVRREYEASLEMAENSRQVLSEALSNAVRMLRQEDVGWAAPNEGQDYRGLDLDELQKWSRDIKTSLTGTRDKAPNPHMRNGLMLRHSFIWDGDIHYDDVPSGGTKGKTNVKKLIDDVNQRLVFSPPARRRREEALYSSGLYLLVGENSTKKLQPVPLHEITDTHRDEFYEDEIIAYRWTRNEAVRDKNNRLTGERKKVSRWVYVDWYTGNRYKRIIRSDGTREPVMDGHTAFDFHANRPDGAPFGSPDAIAAVVWARIIRDLIMNGVKMQDALAMFAFKASAGTKAGQQSVALELGQADQAGSVAATGTSNDLVPMNTAGKGYDFGSIGFVVSTMAAALHVSGIALSANTALAGSSYGAAKTLDLPGRMAMQTRRAEHIEFDHRLLKWMGAPEATVYFHSYDDSTDEYRAVQAAMLMWSSGNLTPEAFRAELEIIYGRKILGSIPKGVVIPNNQKELDAKNAATAATTAAATAPAPDQGKSNGAGDADHAGDIPAKGK